ncbi:helix-turn-helix domain-containing protein [Ferruginibacter albus]|uniref:helix-turn-helix domain-containing protein n=1 Tax=Ferruginibacter albus TaxID=2875540 RepID=UPI001CC71E26|nr:AraC family transcriptional regulator [Ferruginibacter albus]
MHVQAELEKLGLHHKSIKLGEAEIEENADIEKLDELNNALKQSGIELIEDKKSILIEKVKTTIINLIHYSEEPLAINFSVYLSQQLGYDYTYLSNIFSSTLGITIEHYFILHKIEAVKELLTSSDLNITQIAWKMQYSSIAHLSHQFKKITGVSPSNFKKLEHKNRKKLEDL